MGIKKKERERVSVSDHNDAWSVVECPVVTLPLQHEYKAHGKNSVNT